MTNISETFRRLTATTLLAVLPVQGMIAAGAPAVQAGASTVQSAPRRTASAQAAVAAPQAVTSLAFFGPRKYVRTTGPKDVYTSAVEIPAWLKPPFRLFVQNGEADGTFRVSSATVAINGTEILTQSDFKQNAASWERTVTLPTPQPASLTLNVTLASKPTSYLTMWIYGAPADKTAPPLLWVRPADGTPTNDATPELVVQYSDPTGANEPAASGVDLASLRVSIDNVDLSDRFTRRSDEASGEPETPLAEGLHTYKGSIADHAGNLSEITGQFRVDLTGPVLAFTAPPAGAYLATRTPGVTVSYSDEVALDLTTLEVRVNRVLLPATGISAGAATATIAAGTLDEGPNQITATIRDVAGNSASAAVEFNVDVTDPEVVIAQPQAGARIGSRDVTVMVTWSDAQSVDPSTATATIDGTAATLDATADGATAELTRLSNGAHTFTATVADRAGNSGTATVAFIVDTTLPVISVVAPPAGANIKDSTPQVDLQYSDFQGIDTGSLKVTINAADQTALFTKSDTAATGQVAAALPEGTTVVAAEIKDTTGNLGKTTSSFLVDTIAPTGTIEAPASRVISATPLVTVGYADAGSGIDPDSVALTVDGAAIADVLSAGPDSASGALIAPLSDGAHTLEVTFSDRAGNLTTIPASFFVDTVPPLLDVAVPANGTFVSTATPALRVTYADPNGTGLRLTALQLFLQKGSEEEVNVTSWVTATNVEATGLVPAAGALTDGTYLLRAVISDRAGNSSSATSRFEIDTAPPTVVVETPAANGYVSSATPAFTILWNDALSGVDTESAKIFVDGAERTNRFTLTATGATGTLDAAEALQDGEHTVRVIVYDKAGNAAAVVDQTFTVDTVVPTVQIDAPEMNGYVGPAPYVFTATYADADGSGVAPQWVVVTLDGVDRTADFTITPVNATATIATALADGPHTLTVSILDWAGNAATATSEFIADAIAPVVAITSPVAGAWHSGASVEITGTVVDNSPVSLDVNGVVTMATNGAFTATIPTSEGTFTILAKAVDAAGNSHTATVEINVDSAAPVINVTTPEEGFITKDASFALSGTVDDASTVTLLLAGEPLALTSNAFSTSVPLTADGVQTFVLQATDQASNVSTRDVTVTRDSAVPQLTVLSPAAKAVVGAIPVIVSGTLTDATAVTVTVDGVEATVNDSAWQATIPDLEEGTHVFELVATDAAGNVYTTTHEITVDLAAPVITITAPPTGTLTKLGTVTVTGTVSDTTLAAVKLGALTATLTPGTTPGEQLFTLADVPLVDGDNTLTAYAIDSLGRSATAATLVTNDSIAPLVIVDAPQLITRTRPAHVVANVQENLAIRDVVFSLDGTTIATQTTSPFAVDILAPAAAQPGTTLTLSVTATDTAGNITTVSKELRVTSDGAVTGLVLSNATGLPLAGARVSIAGDAARFTTTDARGRYALPANDQNLVLLIEAPATAGDMTAAERTVAIQSGVGTIPVDARLTPLGPEKNVGGNGGSLNVGDVSITIPGGTVSSSTGVRLTVLGAQGLPNLLPLGWSPAAAFDVRIDGTFANIPLGAEVANAPDGTLHLVRYDTAAHAWTVVTTGVTRRYGKAEFSLPQPGAYALVTADDVNVPQPVSGELLAGVAMQPIPDTATSSGSVNPPTLPPTGGSAVGTLTVHSPEPLPSGTVVQAEVTETFSLSTGEIASEEKRTQDLVLFREGNDVTAEFPIVPSRSFPSGALVEGRVHLDILAGREAVRGRTGGSQALTLNAGEITVTVPAGSLPEDLAISATPAVLSTFLPSMPSATALSEVVLDFGGVALGTSATLSISAGSIPAADTVVVARVERVGGVPKVGVVAGTERVDNRFLSKDLGALPGIRRDGRYVFYRLTVPWNLVAGSVALPSASMQAVVTVSGLPFVALTNADGDFATIAPLGSIAFNASVPTTSLSGETTVTVTSGQVAAPNINLTAQATTATITPADGAVRVPTSTQIEIVATTAIRATSANISTISLRDSGGASVQLRFVFSGSGRTLAVVPQTILAAGETYTVTVNGLTDIYGGAINLEPVTFTTTPDEPPNYDTQKIVFTMPGPDGLVTVSAPAGSLPPGTRIMIVNSGNGIVVSFTVGNDGSFTGTFPATINDRLSVTISDPKGNIVTFDRSQFVATDGSGRTAVGPGGGIVEGPGGVQLRIPEGALDAGVVFKVEAIGPEAFEQKPDVPNAHWGAGLKITSEQKPKLKKEADLVFPRPADAPPGSFYYVYRRLDGPNGAINYQAIDHAFDDGNGKVVTASYPFIGWKDSTAAWQAKADVGGLAFGVASEIAFAMVYTWDAMFPGLPVQGAIVGHVYRPVWDPGASEPRYEAVPGVRVKRIAENGVTVPTETVAISEEDGHFALWDSHYTGGTVDVEAQFGNDIVRGTAFEANVSNTRANAFGNLFNTYGYAAEVNLTFPAVQPPPQSPDVEVKVFTLDEANQLRRTEINGVVAAETPLLIGLKFRNNSSGEILNASIIGEEFNVRRDDGGIGTGERMDFIVGTLYQPRHAGTYTVKATALNPLGGAPVEAESTFLVVAGGGTNTSGIPNAAPDWITRKLVPKPGAYGVAIDVLPQVVFTEPVVNVMNGMQFTADSGSAQFTVSAVGTDAQGRPRIIQNLATEPSDTKITSITIVPVGGFDFDTTYTLRLTSAIKDTDVDLAGDPSPRSMPERELTFTTIDPEPLGDAGETFASPAVAVIGDHAYVAKQGPGNGMLAVFDIGDPEDIRQVGQSGVLGMPTHLSAEAESPVNDNEPAVAISSGLKFSPPGPSNVYLFDVRKPSDPKRIAIVSLAESAEDGVILRVALRKSFLYTITFPHGVQIVDLAKATEIYSQADRNVFSRYRMALDSTTAGRGFGQDSVVNTIRVIDPNTGNKAHLMDLTAEEYLLEGSNKMLVVATGSTPFVLIDPSRTTPRITTAPPTAAGNLQFGRALVTTRLGNRNLVLIVGTGLARGASGGLATGTGLFVFDMANPLAPNLIGSHLVADSGSDVDVTGSTAVVATATGAMTFSLADPTSPRYLGTVEGTGYRIALGAEGGYIVSSGQSGLSTSGLHVASFKPVVIIKKADPVMISMENRLGTSNNAQKVNAIAPLTVKIKVVPSVSGLVGSVVVGNKKFVTSDGSDGGVTNEEFTINWTNISRGEGEFTLPPGRQYEDTDLTANATVESDNGTLRSVPRAIRLGWVRLDLDANNNADIDGLDREAARKGRPFAFWESDQFYDLKRLAVNRQNSMTLSDGAEAGGSDKGLADYFTALITVNKLWQTQENPGARVRLWITDQDDANADWRVVVKKVSGKGYLKDKNIAFQQVLAIVGQDASSTPVCQFNDEAIHNAIGECKPNTDGYVTLPPLKSGTYELLVRCVNCRTRDPQLLAVQDLPKMWLDYVPAETPSAGTSIDEIKVEIRPVRQWITYMSAREPNQTTYYKPFPQLRPREQVVPYLDEREEVSLVPDGRQLIWGNAAGSWHSLESRVPAGARDVTVVVHGYNVPDAAMRTVFLPTVFKRLYWVGHPVMRRQGEWRKNEDTPGCAKNCAHMVGISWPSNYLGSEPNENGPRFSGLRAVMAYPEDEYRAFASGVPIAKYLKKVKEQGPGERKIRILAHSLGNLAINSAISRPELKPENGEKVIETYVMNEAAFAAEATDRTYPEDAMVLWGERHAEVYGHKDDIAWQLDWAAMDVITGGGLLRQRWAGQLLKMKDESGVEIADPYEFYTQRWRQERPPEGLMDQDPDGANPNRGPWRGIFHDNRSRTRIYNTWSANDMVLRVIWRANQLEQKPLSRAGRILLERGLRVAWQYYTRAINPGNIDLPPFRAADNMFFQNWTLLDHHPTADHWNTVFGAAETVQGNWTIKRQWGELAYWFPATSYAAGNVSMDDRLPARCRVETCNTDMTTYSGYEGNWSDGSSVIVDAGRAGPHLGTHSYLSYGFFTKVFPAYEEIRKMFDPRNER
jgi:hypothetical protein